jgi:hypothetical protein
MLDLRFDMKSFYLKSQVFFSNLKPRNSEGLTATPPNGMHVPQTTKNNETR